MNKSLLLTSLFSFVFSYYRYYTTKFGNKEFTYKTEDFIEEDTKIEREDFKISSNNIDDVCLLIIDGSLTIYRGVKISKIVPKSNVDNYLKDKPNFDKSDDYKYGLTSCIVAIGENTRVTIDGAIIEIDCPFSNAFVALNGAKIILKNSIIITTTQYSKGITALNKGKGDILANTNITTIGNYSPCLEVNTNGFISIQDSFFYTKGKESPLMNNLGNGNMEMTSSKGVAENSQILVIGGNNYVELFDCELNCTGNLINNNNFNDGGIVLFNNDESNTEIAHLKIFDSSLAINNKNDNISMFSCYNIEAEINLIETKIKKCNIFMKADKIENSTIETKIKLDVKVKKIEGKIIAKNNTEIILIGDKNLYDIETEGNVQFETGLFNEISNPKNQDSLLSKSNLKYLFILNFLIILMILSILIIIMKKI